MQILTPAARPGFHVRPTLPKQCWGFVVGSACFAIGSAPGGLTGILGPSANVVFFVGSWFFTAAALIQLLLSGPMTTEVDGAQLIRAEWLSAAVQFFGTLLFNVSTGAALRAHTIAAEKHFVWNPRCRRVGGVPAQRCTRRRRLFARGADVGASGQRLVGRVGEHGGFGRLRDFRGRRVHHPGRDRGERFLVERGDVRRRTVLPRRRVAAPPAARQHSESGTGRFGDGRTEQVGPPMPPTPAPPVAGFDQLVRWLSLHG